KRIRAYINGRGDHFEVAVTVALGTGMRPGEIFGMRWEDVRQHTIHVPKSKTGTERYALMDDATKAILGKWKRGRSRQKTVLDVKSVKRQWLKMRAELKLPNTFHHCRHTYVTRRRAEGMDWATLGKLVGHTESEMTDVYSFIDHEL